MKNRTFYLNIILLLGIFSFEKNRRYLNKITIKIEAKQSENKSKKIYILINLQKLEYAYTCKKKSQDQKRSENIFNHQ